MKSVYFMIFFMGILATIVFLSGNKEILEFYVCFCSYEGMAVSGTHHFHQTINSGPSLQILFGCNLNEGVFFMPPWRYFIGALWLSLRALPSFSSFPGVLENFLTR